MRGTEDVTIMKFEPDSNRVSQEYDNDAIADEPQRMSSNGNAAESFKNFTQL